MLYQLSFPEISIISRHISVTAFNLPQYCTPNIRATFQVQAASCLAHSSSLAECLLPLEPGSVRHGLSHSHRISSVDGGKSTEAGQPSDVCEIKIHGATFSKTVKTPKFCRKQAIGTLTQELACLLHNSGLWQADTNRLPSSSG